MSTSGPTVLSEPDMSTTGLNLTFVSESGNMSTTYLNVIWERDMSIAGHNVIGESDMSTSDLICVSKRDNMSTTALNFILEMYFTEEWILLDRK